MGSAQIKDHIQLWIAMGGQHLFPKDAVVMEVSEPKDSWGEITINKHAGTYQIKESGIHVSFGWQSKNHFLVPL